MKVFIVRIVFAYIWKYKFTIKFFNIEYFRQVWEIDFSYILT